jgi:hypothetical protein
VHRFTAIVLAFTFAGLLRGESRYSALDAIVVPKTEFVGAEVAECISSLAQKSWALDPAGVGVSLVLRVPRGTKLPRVTLNLADQSLRTVLKSLAEQAGCEMKVEPWAVVLFPKGAKLPVASQTDADPAAAAEQKRLNAIRVPRVTFAGATLKEALTFFVEKAKRLDPQGSGLTLDSKLNEEQAGTRVALTLANCPLDEALRYLCEVGGVKMRIQAKGAEITGGADS